MTKFIQEVSDVIAMLEQENRLIRARNERLEKEVEELTETIKKLEKENHASGRLWQMVRDS